MSTTYRIRMIDGPPGAAGEFAVDPDSTTILGRADDCQIRLIMPTVGRRHAALVWSTHTRGAERYLRLRDLDSRTGTMLNGTPLETGSEIRLGVGDVIGIGPFQLRFEDANDSPSTMHSIRLSEEITHSGMLAESIPLEAPSALAADYLVHLLNATKIMSNAPDMAGIAEAAVRSLVAATSFSNVAFLLQGTTEDRIDALACVGRIRDESGAILVSRTMLRNAMDRTFVYHRGNPKISALASESVMRMDIQDAACVPVLTGNAFHGWLYLDRRGAVSNANLHEVVNFAGVIAHFMGLALTNLARIQVHERMDAEQREMFKGMVRAFIEMIDGKDPYTRGHSDRVSRIAAMLAERAELGAKFVEQARLCGLVHDLGKIGVPEEVLRKPTALEEHEYALIQKHPALGLSILRDIPQLREILPGVLDHHERWDGRGYPNQLAASDISLLGRVVGIADAFDAMTSSRLYRPARTIKEALEEIGRCAGTHFDPTLAAVFAAISPEDLDPYTSHTNQPAPADNE
jgi:hypothetical protein